MIVALWIVITLVGAWGFMMTLVIGELWRRQEAIAKTISEAKTIGETLSQMVSAAQQDALRNMPRKDVH